MKLALEALDQLLLTLWHVAPWLAGLGLAFALLSRFAPCNDANPWWQKRGLFTDLCYWIFAPVFTRYLRIWLTVCLTMWLFHINDGQKIGDFYLHGHGPVSHLPLWLQAIFYVVGTDFALYWIHRGFHRGLLWKYHAVHHASEDLEWTSAARFHPVNLALGAAAVDVVALLCGISPDIFLVVGPFDIITSCMVHANLNWTFGPFRYVLASPVYHRWHHVKDPAIYNRNFAPTFPVWDLLFGTYYMPRGVLPSNYGVDGVPGHFIGQLIYPFRIIAGRFGPARKARLPVAAA